MVGLTSPELHSWLLGEERRLLAFGAQSLVDDRAVWLDHRGKADVSGPTPVFAAARMAYVYSLAHRRGLGGSQQTAASFVRGLTRRFDEVELGWPNDMLGSPTERSAYTHAFVALAAAAATAASIPGAGLLLERALPAFDRFWEPSSGLFTDSWSPSWGRPSAYRGMNGSMHMVEALLALHRATNDERWLDRAHRACQRVASIAEAHDWRIPEHFDQSWSPILDFNAERPDDDFKPFGATIGHAFEWARLMIQCGIARPFERFASVAESIYLRARDDGWDREVGGFCYTTDWSGKPYSRDRRHWVVAEAIGAAAALAQVVSPTYEEDLRRWWTFTRDYQIDPIYGSWHTRLSPNNHPLLEGKPDLYHSYQAVLLSLTTIQSSLVAP